MYSIYKDGELKNMTQDKKRAEFCFLAYNRYCSNHAMLEDSIMHKRKIYNKATGRTTVQKMPFKTHKCILFGTVALTALVIFLAVFWR